MAYVNIEKILIAIMVGAILSALYLYFGGIAAAIGAARYVEQLEAQGQVCEKFKQTSGPAHTRKTYWVCNGKEIKYWNGHFWDWWK